MKQILFTIAACSVFFAVDLSVYAQPMVVTTTPLQSNGHRFFESTNMNWSMRGPNFFATFGGPNIGAPRFGGYNPHVGGYDPHAGSSSGWTFNSGKFFGNFKFNFCQGYERLSATTVPFLTTMNGQTGHFFSGVRRPLVYSLVPVAPPGGAFFSTADPALHRQFRRSGTLAERVLRGDLVLPTSRQREVPGVSFSQSQGKQSGKSPETDRMNAAYAWFQTSPRIDQKTGNDSGLDRLSVEPVVTHVEKLLSNQSDEVAIPINTAAGSDAVLKLSSNKIAEVYLQKGFDAVEEKDIATARFLFRLASEKASGALLKTIQKQITKFDNE